MNVPTPVLKKCAESSVAHVSPQHTLQLLQLDVYQYACDTDMLVSQGRNPVQERRPSNIPRMPHSMKPPLSIWPSDLICSQAMLEADYRYFGV